MRSMSWRSRSLTKLDSSTPWASAKAVNRSCAGSLPQGKPAFFVLAVRGIEGRKRERGEQDGCALRKRGAVFGEVDTGPRIGYLALSIRAMSRLSSSFTSWPRSVPLVLARAAR